jgi:hypothetical protein
MHQEYLKSAAAYLDGGLVGGWRNSTFSFVRAPKLDWSLGLA